MPARLTVLTVALLLAIVSAAAHAQAPYPERTVHIVVPNPPGGVTDLLARIIAQRLAQSWGQAVVVDNRPGGNDTIAAESVARSAPDGYTLFVSSEASLTAAPHLHKDIRYDPFKDFTPIMALGRATPVMNVPAALPVRSVADLIALAKQKPGALNYGSFGNGTYAHLGMEDFKQRAGVNIVHIPYKGSAPAITALLRNEVSVLIVNEATIDPQVKDGKVRIIAAAGARRAAAFPDLPTIGETVPGFATGTYWCLSGPANMPRPVVDRIRADVGAILTGPEAGKLFATNSLEPMQMSAADFAAFLRHDYELQGALIKMVGLGE